VTREGALLSLLLASFTYTMCTMLHGARRWPLFCERVRVVVSDYSAVTAILLFTGLSYAPALRVESLPRLVVPSSFGTTSGRAWLVPLDGLPTWAVFAALVPALVLTVLFFFDHNVSSLLSQRPMFRLKRPSTYNYDFAIVGVTMIVSAFIGVPVANGLIPQAPLHVLSLADVSIERDSAGHVRQIYRGVREQRVSNLMQSLLIGSMLALLQLLALIPKSVLAGLFLHMGVSALSGNDIAARLLHMITEHKLIAPAAYNKLPAWTIHSYTLVQVVLCAIIYVLTLTPAAIAFPLCIMLLMPTREYVLPRYWFTKEELSLLDHRMVIEDDETAGECGGECDDRAPDEELKDLDVIATKALTDEDITKASDDDDDVEDFENSRLKNEI